MTTPDLAPDPDSGPESSREAISSPPGESVLLTPKRRTMALLVAAGRVTSRRTVTWYLDGALITGQSGRALRDLVRAGLIRVGEAAPSDRSATPVTITDEGAALLNREGDGGAITGNAVTSDDDHSAPE